MLTARSGDFNFSVEFAEEYGFMAPIGTAMLLAYRSTKALRALSPVALVGTVAAETLVKGLGVAGYQYINASKSALVDAENLAAHVCSIRNDAKYIRIVAHSLGCQLVLNACNLLSLVDRPNEIHLCAAGLHILSCLISLHDWQLVRRKMLRLS